MTSGREDTGGAGRADVEQNVRCRDEWGTRGRDEDKNRITPLNKQKTETQTPSVQSWVTVFALDVK